MAERASREREGNLPAETTRLIGRREELAQVGRLFERSRLVTVTGAAGVGKSRLALRAVAELQPQSADGAWWVALSPLREGSVLPHAIAESLPLVDQTTRPALDVLAEYLAERELLLVLDTCEHLIGECSLIVKALLAAAPGLRVLATSRRPLVLPDEQVFRLDPLPLPAAEDLLADRAAAATPGFAVDAGNRETVGLVCRRLEGLPLAIELAAARLRVLSLSELANRLDDRGEDALAELGVTDRAVYGADPPWHQALRTAIGWSHQLCSPAERLLWARVSVFAGSFDVESAVQVCADDRLPAGRVPSLLAELADKSILTWEPTGGGERYRMLDSIREYGVFYLHRLGEHEWLRRRHREHYRELARQGDAAWMGAEQFAWYDLMTAEHDNLRVALEFCLAEPEGHAALELVGNLFFFWYTYGFAKEGHHYLERALALDTQPSREHTKALWACGFVLLNQGDAIAAEARGDQCHREAEERGDTGAAVFALALTTCTASMRGDPARSLALIDRLLAAPRGEGEDPFPTWVARAVQSHVHMNNGRSKEAIVTLEQVRAECDRHGERWMRSYSDVFRAQAEMRLGHPEDAQSAARAALKVKQRMNDRMGIAFCADVLAIAAAALGRAERAACLLGLAQGVWDTVGVPQIGVPEFVAARRACEEQARQALGDPAYQHAFGSGRTFELQAGVAYALSDLDACPPASLER